MYLKRALGGAAAILPVMVIDRLIKIWAEESLTGAPELVPGVLGLRLAHNKGAAFSMFSSKPIVTIVLTGVVLALLIAYLIAKGGISRTVRWGMWLIVAGGLGNLYDRLAYGYVVDMLEFRFMDFAVFNIADVCICVGAGLTILGFLLAESRRKTEGEGG